MLFSLSDEKQAPKFLSKLNEKSKLPLRALVTTYILIVAIIIIANFYSNAVFSLLNIIGSLVIIVWANSSWAQVRLRKAIKRQGQDINQLLPYKSPLYPLGPILVFATLIFLYFGNSIGDLFDGNIGKFFVNILPIIILGLIFLAHKLIRKTKFVKLNDMDITPHHYHKEN